MEIYDKIRFLTRRKYPDYRMLRTASPGDDPKTNERREAFSAFTDRLNTMAPRDLDELWLEEDRKEQVEQHEAAERFDRGAFFSQPDADANFAYWRVNKTWTIDEATALLLAKNPFIVKWDSLKDLIHASLFARKYQALRNQLLRAEADGTLADKASPVSILSWANNIGWPVPGDLNSYAGESNRSTAADMSTRERQSLLKLVIVMAMKKYGYDPDAAKNPATKEIADDLTRMGLELTDDTVRKYLKAGTELIAQTE